ncbi:MAG: hypothetical protein KBC62_04125 [Candidatus Pacebacteria bacterium]|nr:hypothetical protein [Candidatus Paceibacterota bacterium]
MTTFLTLVAILQSFSISLGVGSSTLAIANFFVAISDGGISPDERRMMGVVYIVLRVAMILILLTTLCLLAAQYSAGTLFLVPFNIAQLSVIGVLFVNAMLMTAHIVPSNFGPAIQAGNWYTLGTLAALTSLSLTTFTLGHFFLAYVTWIVLAISIVNGIMAIQVARRNKLIT